MLPTLTAPFLRWYTSKLCIADKLVDIHCTGTVVTLCIPAQAHTVQGSTWLHAVITLCGYTQYIGCNILHLGIYARVLVYINVLTYLRVLSSAMRVLLLLGLLLVPVHDCAATADLVEPPWTTRSNNYLYSSIHRTRAHIVFVSLFTVHTSYLLIVGYTTLAYCWLFAL